VELVDLPRFVTLWQVFYQKLTDEDKAMLPLMPIISWQPQVEPRRFILACRDRRKELAIRADGEQGVKRAAVNKRAGRIQLRQGRYQASHWGRNNAFRSIPKSGTINKQGFVLAGATNSLHFIDRRDP